MLKMLEICYVRYSHKVILLVFKHNNFIQFITIKKAPRQRYFTVDFGQSLILTRYVVLNNPNNLTIADYESFEKYSIK